MTPGDDLFTLELPRDAAFVATARMFASALARHYEVEEEVVEDLKLAISEACKRALGAGDDAGSLSVTAARDNGRLVFEVSQNEVPQPAEEDTHAPSNEQMAAGFSLELISALFEDAAIVHDAHGMPVVRFSVSA